ncbi:MAG: hypothetical protein M0P61_06390 [Ignavibacteriaceae bacterium]|nr:hypothetical protein [Ignavibacteriaceae bacterium]
MKKENNLKAFEPEYLNKIGQKQKDFFDDIRDYIRSLIRIVITDSEFEDLDFQKNSFGKQTYFQNTLEINTIDFLLEILSNSDDVAEEYLVNKAKKFIITRFKVDLKYSVPKRLIEKNDNLVKTVSSKLTQDIKDFATKNEFPKYQTVGWKKINNLLTFLQKQHPNGEINKDSVARILRRLDYSTSRDSYLKD